MAKLYISEYTELARDTLDRPLTAAKEPCITDQAPLTVGTEVKSAAFNDYCHVIRVHTDAICSIAIGANPTATTSNKRLAAGQTEYFGVQPGHKLSVISNT